VGFPRACWRSPRSHDFRNAKPGDDIHIHAGIVQTDSLTAANAKAMLKQCGSAMEPPRPLASPRCAIRSSHCHAHEHKQIPALPPPPLLGSCALALISAAALPSAALACINLGIIVESVKIAQDPFAANAVTTARLKLNGANKEFKFPGNAQDDNIGFSYQCQGMDYPAKPWPANCSVSFRGPSVNQSLGASDVAIECEGDICRYTDLMGQHLNLPSAPF